MSEVYKHKLSWSELRYTIEGTMTINRRRMRAPRAWLFVAIIRLLVKIGDIRSFDIEYGHTFKTDSVAGTPVDLEVLMGQYLDESEST